MKRSHAMQGELEKILLTPNTENSKLAHEQYLRIEMTQAEIFAREQGYHLDVEQVHTSGERYMMSGKKLVLTGRRNGDKLPVIIKFSTDRAGRNEIEHEHWVDRTLRDLNFAAHSFAAPLEYDYQKTGTYTARVVEFIEEKRPFLSLPVTEQFFLAVDSFKIQAGLHATTYGHIRDVKNVFGLVTAEQYLEQAALYQRSIVEHAPPDVVGDIIERAMAEIHDGLSLIHLYSGFLTHTDFAPHNVRLQNGTLYLLDQTSLHFGNKHESWARFINYMTLYNQTLAEYLLTYIRENKADTEYHSLRLLRIYKLIYLMAFYVSSYRRSVDRHQELSLARLHFWTSVLTDVLEDRTTDPAAIAEYQAIRDELRDEAERKRQRILGQL